MHLHFSNLIGFPERSIRRNPNLVSSILPRLRQLMAHHLNTTNGRMERPAFQKDIHDFSL
jgi:hypothetical protein